MKVTHPHPNAHTVTTNSIAKTVLYTSPKTCSTPLAFAIHGSSTATRAMKLPAWMAVTSSATRRKTRACFVCEDSSFLAWLLQRVYVDAELGLWGRGLLVLVLVALLTSGMWCEGRGLGKLPLSLSLSAIVEAGIAVDEFLCLVPSC